MSELERLKMSIADDILQVVDFEAPRGDVQGVAEVTAGLVIARVAKFIATNDWDVEDLL